MTPLQAVGLDALTPWPCARVYSSVNQSIPTASTTAITFDSISYDTGGFWNPASPTKLTIGKAGIYLCGAMVDFAANATGERYMEIAKNALNYTALGTFVNAPAGGGAFSGCSGMYSFVAGDYIELYVHQESGGNLNSQGSAPDFPCLWILWIPS